MMQHLFSKQDIYSIGFQNSDSVDELFLSGFSHFIAPVATTDSENRKFINAASIAVEDFHHWRGEMVHYNGKQLNKSILNLT